jgi:hypothetical protein
MSDQVQPVPQPQEQEAAPDQVQPVPQQQEQEAAPEEQGINWSSIWKILLFYFIATQGISFL